MQLSAQERIIESLSSILSKATFNFPDDTGISLQSATVKSKISCERLECSR